MKYFKFANILLFGLVCLFVLTIFAPIVSAQNFDPLGTCIKFDTTDPTKCIEYNCTGAAANGPVCKQKAEQLTKNTNPVVDTIHTATDILGLVAAIGAIIIIIYSGFVFVTAGGALSGSRSGDNPNRARQARSSLTGAIIGLIIVALSWAIITFFTNRLL